MWRAIRSVNCFVYSARVRIGHLPQWPQRWETSTFARGPLWQDFSRAGFIYHAKGCFAVRNRYITLHYATSSASAVPAALCMFGLVPIF